MRPASGDLAVLAREMSIAAEQVRELPFKLPVEVIEGSPAVVSWLLQREVEELRATGELEIEQVTLEAFGFVPAGGDYEALLLDLYEEQVRGLYDHREKILLVIPTDPVKTEGADQEAHKAAARLEAGLFLLHEIVHALQDQHFGLARFMDDAETLDQSLAGRALVEGDATFAMYEYFLGGFGRSLSDLSDLSPIVGLFTEAMNAPEHRALQEAPLYVRETLMFSYLAGLVFVHALHGIAGWDAVNAAFAQPPTTTSQILHPERYLAGVGGETLQLPSIRALDDAGYERMAEGSMGELGLRLFLAEHAGGTPQPGVACEWRGDTYAVYTKEDLVPVAAWTISLASVEGATALVEEIDESFSQTTPVFARQVGPDIVGIVTHLTEADADLALESLENVGRTPAQPSPFEAPPSLSDAGEEEEPAQE